MDEREIKKLDEKGEEKISGGMNTDKDKLLKSAVDPKMLSIVTYGAPLVRPVTKLPTELIKYYNGKKIEETKEENKPEEALTASQPQTEEKK